MKYNCRIIENGSLENNSLIEEYYDLRQSIFNERLGINNCGEDKWDELSYICIVEKSGKCVAGSRLTVAHHTSKQSLPMEDENFFLRSTLDFTIESGKYAEYSKLVVEQGHDAFALSMMQYLEIEKLSRELNLSYVFSITPSKQARLYRLAFNKYQKEIMGHSCYNILERVNIPMSIKNKYNGAVERLTVVSINC